MKFDSHGLYISYELTMGGNLLVQAISSCTPIFLRTPPFLLKFPFHPFEMLFKKIIKKQNQHFYCSPSFLHSRHPSTHRCIGF